jgi:hypothetical protein
MEKGLIKGKKELEKILKLMGENKINKSLNNDSIINVVALNNNKKYAVILEGKDYFIKETSSQNEKIYVDEFQYIGGLQNKNKHKFESYQDALKRLNLLVHSINESIGYVKNVDIINNDFIISENKRYVLKQKKTKEPTVDFQEPTRQVAPQKTEDPKASDFKGDDEMGDDEMDTEVSFDDEMGDDEMDDLDIDEEDDIKMIQKLTGKLGQKLRSVQNLDSQTLKWVSKSILSAIDMDLMDRKDKQDLIKTIKKKIKKQEDDDSEYNSIAPYKGFGSKKIDNNDEDLLLGKEKIGFSKYTNNMGENENIDDLIDFDVDLSDFDVDLSDIETTPARPMVKPNPMVKPSKEPFRPKRKHKVKPKASDNEY